MISVPFSPSIPVGSRISIYGDILAYCYYGIQEHGNSIYVNTNCSNASSVTFLSITTKEVLSSWNIYGSRYIQCTTGYMFHIVANATIYRVILSSHSQCDPIAIIVPLSPFESLIMRSGIVVTLFNLANEIDQSYHPIDIPPVKRMIEFNEDLVPIAMTCCDGVNGNSLILLDCEEGHSSLSPKGRLLYTRYFPVEDIIVSNSLSEDGYKLYVNIGQEEIAMDNDPNEFSFVIPTAPGKFIKVVWSQGYSRLYNQEGIQVDVGHNILMIDATNIIGLMYYWSEDGYLNLLY